jgi:hypothetical protein
VDVCSSFVAEAEPPVLVEPGEGAFDDSSLTADSRGRQGARAALGAAALAAHGRDRLDPRQQLRDIVAIRRRRPKGEWDPACVSDQTVLGTAFAPVDRARASLGAQNSRHLSGV